MNRHAKAPSEARRQYTRPSVEPKITRPRYTVGGESTLPPDANDQTILPFLASRA